MKKILLSLILVTGITGAGLKAQSVSNAVSSNYSEAVVEKVYTLLKKTKTNMPQARQLQFAAHFKKQDSLVALFIKNNQTEKQLDSLRKVLDTEFSQKLNANERFNYYTGKNTSNSSVSKIPFSQLSYVIKLKDSLQLSEGVKETLLQKLDQLKVEKDSFYAKNKGKSYDARPFESETLSHLLNDDQYVKFLNIKNAKKALNYANNDWNELVQRNLSTPFNKEETVIKLTEFYLARQNTYDRYAHDKLVQNDAIKLLYENRPAALNTLLHARRNPDNDTIGNAFQW